MKISVIGAGSWGSALAELASRCGHEVMLWAHDPRVAQAIEETRSNPYYLPAAQFSPLVKVTNSLQEAAEFSDTFLTLAALAPLLSAVLYNVGARDPWLLMLVATLLVLVALLVSTVPARRAAGVDPVTVLREN